MIVDPGPTSRVEKLLEQLGGEEPRALLLTHIHLDHSGVRILPAGHVVAPTPPPDIDLELWEAVR